jgi:hypothetical protein
MHGSSAVLSVCGAARIAIMPMSLRIAAAAACAGAQGTMESISFPACFTHLRALARKLLHRAVTQTVCAPALWTGSDCREVRACVTRVIDAIAQAADGQLRCGRVVNLDTRRTLTVAEEAAGIFFLALK